MGWLRETLHALSTTSGLIAGGLYLFTTRKVRREERAAALAALAILASVGRFDLDTEQFAKPCAALRVAQLDDSILRASFEPRT